MNDIAKKNGLHAGIAIVILGSILHAIDPRVFINWYGFVGYMVFLFFMIRSVRQVKRSEGGILPFGSAFVSAFVTMTIGVFFSSFFNYAIHNWINPDIVILLKEIAIESSEMVMEKMSTMFDMDVDMDEITAALEEQDYSLNMGSTILTWFMTTAMGCVPSLIIAAFMKKSED